MANPSDGVSLKRIINIPPRGIGEKTIEKIEALCREKTLSLYEGLKEALKEDWLSPATKTKIDAFIQMMEEFRKDASAFSLSQLTQSILTKTGYLDRFKEEGTDEALSRIENIDELVNGMMEFEHGEEEVSLETFLDKVSLVSDVDLYEDKGNRVSLMTLHCAKGLEFPVIFIVGMEEGLLPHYRRGEEIEDLEEERRLCYVGITRAKEKLYLSRAERRSTFGVGRANLPSRFLEELPPEMIDIEEPRPEEDKSWSEEPFADWVHPEMNEPSHVSDVFRNPREQEVSSSLSEERVLSPEGFYPLKIGMKVKHSKFGVGRVRSVEGTNEDQKATIIFQTVGVKRLKVAYAHFEILE